MIQSVDNECYGKNLQASFKQSFIREEKNRGEKKKKDDVDIIETNGSIDDDMKFCSGKKSGEMLRWECYINEAFKVQSWVEIVVGSSCATVTVSCAVEKVPLISIPALMT